MLAADWQFRLCHVKFSHSFSNFSGTHSATHFYFNSQLTTVFSSHHPREAINSFSTLRLGLIQCNVKLHKLKHIHDTVHCAAMMNTIRQYSGSYCFQSNYGQSVGANFISEVKQLISIIFLYIFPTVTFLDSWTTLQKSNSWVKREASFLCGWESCCPPTPIL